jgi:hypothetical protein
LVDFLHSTTPMVSHERLYIYIEYLEIGYTHKLDWTTVTVGAPCMLAISTIPASAGVSSSTWATTGSTAPVSRGGFWPPLFCRHSRLISNSRLLCRLWHRCLSGGDWTLNPLSHPSHCVPGFVFRLVHGVGRGNILRQLKTQLSACNTPLQVIDYTSRGTYLLGS